MFLSSLFYTNPTLEPACSSWTFLLHWEGGWLTLYFSISCEFSSRSCLAPVLKRKCQVSYLLCRGWCPQKLGFELFLEKFKHSHTVLSKPVLRNASARCGGGDVRRETRLYMLKIPRFKLFAQASQSTWTVGLCSLNARTDLQGDVPAAGFQRLCVFRVKVGLCFPRMATAASVGTSRRVIRTEARARGLE